MPFAGGTGGTIGNIRPMATAIIRALTNEGIVIAADQRLTQDTKGVVSDSTRKIFEMGHSAAYCMYGTTLMGDVDPTNNHERLPNCERIAA
jgi:hypothetical protein